MASRAVVGLRIGRAEAGREAAERLRAVKGVTVRGAVLSEREGVAAVLMDAEDLRALKEAVKEVEKVEGVKGVIVLISEEDLWAELARM